MHFRQSSNRKHTLLSVCGIALSTLFILGTMGLGTASAASNDMTLAKTVLVSPDYPLALSQIPQPTFPNVSAGATSVQGFDEGNWHYELHYRYNQQQGWHATQYQANRIHESKLPPIAQSILSPNVGCGPPGSPNVTTPHGASPSLGCNPIPRGAPDPTDLPPPSPPGPNQVSPGDTRTKYWSNYNGSGWKVTAKWEWVIDPQTGIGHWELVYVLEIKIPIND